MVVSISDLLVDRQPSCPRLH